MKLVVGNRISDRNPQDVYILYLKVMHGDADGYETVEVMRCPNDDFDLEELYSLLQIIDRTKDLYEDDLLQAIKGTKLEKVWPKDPGDYTIPGSHEAHWLRYFDKDGVEFAVTVVE